jgi:hypothetical protein
MARVAHQTTLSTCGDDRNARATSVFVPCVFAEMKRFGTVLREPQVVCAWHGTNSILQESKLGVVRRVVRRQDEGP